MKKLLFAALIVIISSGCTNEYKAKKTIEKYLSERLHDWKSYESVSFGEIDSLFQMMPDDPFYKIAEYKKSEYIDLVNKSLDEFDLYKDIYSDYSFRKQGIILDEAKIYRDSALKYTAYVDSFMVEFEPYFIGWKVDHSYRANNAGGNKVIGHYRFHLDEKLENVIEVIDLSD